MSKQLSVLLFLIVSLLVCRTVESSAAPTFLDTTIRILIVKDGGATQQFIDDSVAHLQDTWSQTPGTRPVSITIVNPGAALGLSLIGEDSAFLLDDVREFASTTVPTFTQSFRNLHSADLVIAFTDNLFGSCGATQNGTWLGSLATFFPDSDGVDTRGAADWFVALVYYDVTGVLCADNGSFAHELGHLFGASHEPGAGGGIPLNANGHGDFFAINIPRLVRKSFRSNMVTSSVCAPGFICLRVKRYSNPEFLGDPSRQVVETVDETAESVANFVRKVPPPPPPPLPPPNLPLCIDGIDNDGDGLIDLDDPDCIDSSDDDESSPAPPPAPPSCDPGNYIPTNVQVRVDTVCWAGTFDTLYEVTWAHACLGGIYQLFANDGFGDYFVIGTPVRSALIRVSGPSSVKVRACGSVGCSGKSFPPVPVFDSC